MQCAQLWLTVLSKYCAHLLCLACSYGSVRRAAFDFNKVVLRSEVISKTEAKVTRQRPMSACMSCTARPWLQTNS